MRNEIRFAGFGGQGVVLAGVLLGTSAVLHDGKHAVQTQSYGAAARGGAARSDVIVSDEEIVYPQVTAPDIMVAFTSEAFRKYCDELSPGALLIIDSDLVELPEDVDFDVHDIPATTIAVNELGKSIVANMIMLGYLVGLTAVVTVDAVEKAIRDSVPKGTEELNLNAFNIGLGHARNELAAS